jgi:beta-galactosidase
MKKILLISVSLSFTMLLFSQHFAGRKTELFNNDWKFYKGTPLNAFVVDFKDKDWVDIDLPHDWSIEDLPEVKDDGTLRINLVPGAWKYALGDLEAWKNLHEFDGNWDLITLPEAVNSRELNAPFYSWYRKGVKIPKMVKGKKINLNLGKIKDADQTYFNGVLIGSTGAMPPAFEGAAELPRVYEIPEHLINFDGKNVVAIRVYSLDGQGGMYEALEERIISGPFDSYSPGGRATAFTMGGVGWYRKHFKIPKSDKGKKFRLEFEGAYMETEVWVNGTSVGANPHGYTPFSFDISRFIYPGKDNVVTVKVENSGENSRWYSGSGIYRNVRLVTENKTHHDELRSVVTYSGKLDGIPYARFETEVKNSSHDSISMRWTVEVYNSLGERLFHHDSILNMKPLTALKLVKIMPLPGAALWSPDQPNLLSLQSQLVRGIVPIDGISVPFGLRAITFSAQRGLLINGEPILLKGGCIHHDHGALGAMAFDAAEERKVLLLKNAGYNALRTAHNPPSKAFLAACDRLGMMVIEEAYDQWNVMKKPHDYHRFFATWWERDIENMVLNHRNHPSVIMWSIGNEVPERFKPEGAVTARMLVQKIKSLDTTRPITNAINKGKNDVWDDADEHFAAVDIAGYNYYPDGYDSDQQRIPERVIVSSESFPAQAYDYWQHVVNKPWVIGDFVWTAMDYLGESGIGWYSFQGEPKNMFPWTTAFCGDLDITGNPRPQWYFRNTLWSDKVQVHLMVKNPEPSFTKRERIAWGWEDVSRNWTWKNYNGYFFEVIVYTNGEKVVLYQNGQEIASKVVTAEMKNRVSFIVPYKAGTLMSTALRGDEKVNDLLKTAGIPAKLNLKANKLTAKADGQDLIYVDVEIHDAEGVLNPTIQTPLHFAVSGSATIVGIANGNPQNTESFKGPLKTTWEGRCQVILRTARKSGNAVLTVSAPQTPPTTISLQIDEP